MKLSRKELKAMEDLARELRITVLKMLYHAGSGHSGGSLSVVDILVALFFAQLRCGEGHEGFYQRDHFVLSKGHAAPCLYAVLAKKGFFSDSGRSRMS